MELEPHIPTPPKTHRVIGIVTVVLAGVLILAGIYAQFAVSYGWWPFGMG